MILKFKIYGNPIAKQSTRFCMDSRGNPRTYTPSKIVRWEKDIKLQCLNYRQNHLFDEFICLSATFYMPRPKSVKKTQVWANKRPDLTNLLKPLEDSMEGLIFTNDSRIVMYKNISKQYTDSEPYIEIEIEEMK